MTSYTPKLGRTPLRGKVYDTHSNIAHAKLRTRYLYRARLAAFSGRE
jgi:hypothetical protein